MRTLFVLPSAARASLGLSRTLKAATPPVQLSHQPWGPCTYLQVSLRAATEPPGTTSEAGVVHPVPVGWIEGCRLAGEQAVMFYPYTDTHLL